MHPHTFPLQGSSMRFRKLQGSFSTVSSASDVLLPPKVLGVFRCAQTNVVCHPMCQVCLSILSPPVLGNTEAKLWLFAAPDQLKPFEMPQILSTTVGV